MQIIIGKPGFNTTISVDKNLHDEIFNKFTEFVTSAKDAPTGIAFRVSGNKSMVLNFTLISYIIDA